MVYKCLEGSVPEYLKELMKLRRPTREGLRSGTQIKPLIVPFTRQKIFASRSFSLSVHALWNKIPDRLRAIANFETFKKELKTLLGNFIRNFNLLYESMSWFVYNFNVIC